MNIFQHIVNLEMEEENLHNGVAYWDEAFSGDIFSGDI